MDFGGLLGFVQLLVLIGIFLGVGLFVLAEVSSAIGGDAGTAINNTITELATIPSTWLGILVVAVMAAIILAVVIGSFGRGSR